MLSLVALTGPTAIIECGANGPRRSLTLHPLSGYSVQALAAKDGSLEATYQAARQVLADAPDEVDALTTDELDLVLEIAHGPILGVLQWLAEGDRRDGDSENGKPKGEGIRPRDFVLFVLVTVATATQQSVESVAHRPYAETLLTFAQLNEIERFEGVRNMGDRLDLAHLVALSFHEPKKLTQAAYQYERLAGRLPSVEDTKAKALEMVNADRAANGLPPLTEF